MSVRPRPGILDISPYKGGKAGANHASPVRLASNENPFGPSPLAMDAYKDIAGDLHRYPDGHALDLKQAITRHHAIDQDLVLCAAGSDELISLLIQAYAGPGMEVLFSDHSFAMYELSALAHGAHPVCVADRNLAADLDALRAGITSRTRLIFLANPNNPTGSWLGPDELAAFAGALPPDVLLVLDAAYAEYAEHRPDYESGLALVGKHPNVVMIRTFSKIYGLAALRLGWLYGCQSVVDVLHRVRGPFNVSMAAQAAGMAALADHDYRARSIRHNEAMLETATNRLTALGFGITPSVANFLLVHVPVDFGMRAVELLDRLEPQGIMLRGMSSYGLPDHIRVTMGSDADMERLFTTIEGLVP